MKTLLVVIVVAALAAGTVAWASAQDTCYSWGQYHWHGTNQMQMVGQPPYDPIIHDSRLQDRFGLRTGAMLAR